MKKISSGSARDLICRCKHLREGKEESVEISCDKIENLKGFCYLGDRLNARGGCEPVGVTLRVKIGWVKFMKSPKFS